MELVSLIVNNQTVAGTIIGNKDFCFRKVEYEDGFILMNVFSKHYLSINGNGYLEFCKKSFHPIVFKENKIFVNDVEYEFVLTGKCVIIKEGSCNNFYLKPVEIDKINLSILVLQNFENIDLLKKLINTYDLNIENLLSNIILTSYNKDLITFLLDKGCIPNNEFYCFCFSKVEKQQIDANFISNIMSKNLETLNESTFLNYLINCKNDQIFQLIISQNINYDYVSEEGDTFLQASLRNDCNKIEFLLTNKYTNINVYNKRTGKNAILELLIRKYDNLLLEKVLNLGADSNSISRAIYKYHTLDYNKTYHEILIKYGAQEKFSLNYYENLDKTFEYQDINMHKQRFLDYLKIRKGNVKKFNYLINKSIFLNIFKKHYYINRFIIPEIINLIADYFLDS